MHCEIRTRYRVESDKPKRTVSSNIKIETNVDRSSMYTPDWPLLRISTANSSIQTALGKIIPLLLAIKRNHDAKWGLTCHIMVCLTRWNCNGFLFFHLPCIKQNQSDVPSPNQLNQSSPRCPKRSHDAKFALRDFHFTSWPSSLEGIPMDFCFFIFNESIQLIWMCHYPIS